MIVIGSRKRLAVTVLGLLLIATIWFFRSFWMTRSIEDLERRSVLVIVIDTLRADFLGSYGFEGEISPNLDALAKESILFERCVAPAPWTIPSIASVFVSEYPAAHKVLLYSQTFRDKDVETVKTGVLPKQATTMAEAFQRAGYSTAAFVANLWLQPSFGFARGFDTYRFGRDQVLLPKAFNWMRAQDQPFLAYLHLFNVHGPYLAPEADVNYLRRTPGVGESERIGDESFQSIPAYLREPQWAQMKDVRDLREWRVRYGAQIRETDRQLGRFFSSLHREGLLDEMIIVVTSDHGEELGEHGGWNHGHNLYGHQLDVPLLMRLPGGAKNGINREVVSLVDLVPTLASMVEIPVDPRWQGLDLTTSILDGQTPEGDRVVFASGVKANTRMRASVGAQFKLIEDEASGKRMLFDLDSDPSEMSDVAQRHPNEVAASIKHLRTHLASSIEAANRRTETAEISGQLRKQLESMGYVQP